VFVSTNEVGLLITTLYRNEEPLRVSANISHLSVSGIPLNSSWS